MMSCFTSSKKRPADLMICEMECFGARFSSMSTHYKSETCTVKGLASPLFDPPPAISGVALASDSYTFFPAVSLSIRRGRFQLLPY